MLHFENFCLEIEICSDKPRRELVLFSEPRYHKNTYGIPLPLGALASTCSVDVLRQRCVPPEDRMPADTEGEVFRERICRGTLAGTPGIPLLSRYWDRGEIVRAVSTRRARIRTALIGGEHG